MQTRVTLSQSVSTAVINWIRSEGFAPGDYIATQDELMDRFKVGRNTVREAIQSLVAVGLLDVRPGRGVTLKALEATSILDANLVASLLSDGSIEDLYQFRAVLEPAMARIAAKNADQTDLSRISAALAVFEEGVESDRPLHIEDTNFHSAIAQATKNQLFVLVLDAISSLINEARQQVHRVPGEKLRAYKEHAAIATALAARDAEAAEAAMASHIDTAVQAVRKTRNKTVGGARPGSAARSAAER